MFGQQNNSPFGGGGFGQSNTTPAFGQPAQAPGLFGSPPPQQQPFGQSQSTFGTSTFGQPAPAPSMFGAPQPAPAFGSTFGSPAPAFGAPAPSTGLFGAPAPSTGGIFGSAPTPAPSTSPFGGGSTFGMPAPAPAFGSSFGAPAPSGGLFGSSPAPAPFGQAPSTGLFGSTPAPTTFGQPAPATGGFGGFGAPAPSAGFGTSTFGSPAPAFGAPAPSGGGLFGTPQGNTQEGTRHTGFTPSVKQDGSSSISVYSITGMPQYENKSVEELRFEDYRQGNKGTPSSGAAPSGGMFGSAPAPTGGLFGSSAPSTGGFGSSPAPAFGSSSAPAFGSSPAPAFGSSFGSAPAPAPFGQTSGTTGGFGFGAPSPAPSGGLFGSSAPAPAPTGGFSFGGPSPAPSGGLFGSSSPAPAPFGAPAPSGGLFGSSAPAATGGFSFGGPSPAPSGGLFGSSPAPSGGLFGSSPAPSTGFGFGSPAPSSGFGFGASPSAPAPAFGAPAFGAPAPIQAVPAPQPTSLFPPNAQIIVPATNELLEQNIRAMMKQKEELEKSQTLRAGESKSPAVTPRAISETEGFGSLGQSSFGLRDRSPRSAYKIKPRGFPQLESATKGSPMSISNTPARNGVGTSMMSPQAYLQSSKLKLRIDKDSITKPRLRGSLSSPIPSLPNRVALENGSEVSKPLPLQTNGQELPSGVDSPRNSPVATSNAEESKKTVSPAEALYRSVIGAAAESPSAFSTKLAPKAAAKVPKLTKDGYVCEPSLSELEKYSDADLATVSRFSVRREGYGMIEWEGQVDVRGVDIDQAVIIEHKEVSCYTLDEKEDKKPPVGTKLNRPAIITLYNIFPKDGAQSSDDDFFKFEEKLRKSNRKSETHFLSYDRRSGTWAFKVQHFSRYGLFDDDDDDSQNMEVDEHASKSTSAVSFDIDSTKPVAPTRVQRQQTPYKAFGLILSESEDEEQDHVEEQAADQEMVLSLKADDAILSLRAEVMDFVSSRESEGENPSYLDDEESADDDQLRIREHEQQLINSLVFPATQRNYCEELASRHSCQKSSLDTRRLLRSFRTSWTKCLEPISINAIAVETHQPALQSRLSPSSQEQIIRLFCGVAQRPRSVDQGIALSLPRSMHLSGNKVSHDKLRSLLKSIYSDLPKKSELASALNLVICLFDTLDVPATSAGRADSLDDRRRYSILKWVRESKAQESDGPSNVVGGVLEAFACGDIRRASTLASQNGMYELASLVSSGVGGAKELSEYLSSTSLSFCNESQMNLLRLLDPSRTAEIDQVSGTKLDWKDHLALRLMRGVDNDVDSILTNFFRDVEASIVPFPKASTRESNTYCTTYQLLRVTMNPRINLQSVLDPVGMGFDDFDFCPAFFLGLVLNSCFSPVDNSTFESVADSYSSQLLSYGRWDLAAAISVFCCGSETRFEFEQKMLRAKDLIYRHFTDRSVGQRDLLVSLGFPTSWFHHSLSRQAAYRGELLRSLHYMTQSSDDGLIQHSIAPFEEKMMPLLYFTDLNYVREYLPHLAESSKSGTASNPVEQYLDLYHEADKLFAEEAGNVSERASSMKKEVQIVRDGLRQIVDRQREERTKKEFFPSPPKAIPLKSMIQDAVAHLDFLELQLGAICQGIPFASPKNVATQRLSFGSSDLQQPQLGLYNTN